MRDMYVPRLRGGGGGVGTAGMLDEFDESNGSCDYARGVSYIIHKLMLAEVPTF